MYPEDVSNVSRSRRFYRDEICPVNRRKEEKQDRRRLAEVLRLAMRCNWQAKDPRGKQRHSPGGSDVGQSFSMNYQLRFNCHVRLDCFSRE